MAHWLAPRVAGFRREHPDIDLELHASDQPVSLSADHADIAVRYGRGPDPGMHVEPLFSDTFAPLASPALGKVDLADDRVPLIAFRWARDHPLNPTWQAWFAAAGRPWAPRAGRLRFSDEGHAIQAALSGQGVALLSLELLTDELHSGRLVRLPGPLSLDTFTTWSAARDKHLRRMLLRRVHGFPRRRPAARLYRVKRQDRGENSQRPT